MRNALKTILKAVAQLLLALFVFVLAGGDAVAGPLLTRLRERRQQHAPATPAAACGSCGGGRATGPTATGAGGSCSSPASYGPVAEPLVSRFAPVVSYGGGSPSCCPSCSGGSCPAPTGFRRR